MMMSSQNGYATNRPYIRTCKTSAKWTSRGAEDERINRTTVEDQRKTEQEAEARARLRVTSSRSKSTGNMQEATVEAGNHRSVEDQ